MRRANLPAYRARAKAANAARMESGHLKRQNRKGCAPAVSKVVTPASTKGWKSCTAAWPAVLSLSLSPLQHAMRLLQHSQAAHLKAEKSVGKEKLSGQTVFSYDGKMGSDVTHGHRKVASTP